VQVRARLQPGLQESQDDVGVMSAYSDILRSGNGYFPERNVVGRRSHVGELHIRKKEIVNRVILVGAYALVLSSGEAHFLREIYAVAKPTGDSSLMSKTISRRAAERLPEHFVRSVVVPKPETDFLFARLVELELLVAAVVVLNAHAEHPAIRSVAPRPPGLSDEVAAEIQLLP
jgi:hypothetical protein